MGLLGPLPSALGIPSGLGIRQMQARDAELGHTIALPGRPKHSSAALLSHRHYSLLQQEALADPSWQPRDVRWHAGLVLG